MYLAMLRFHIALSAGERKKATKLPNISPRVGVELVRDGGEFRERRREKEENAKA